MNESETGEVKLPEWSLSCPKCERHQHWTCGRKECSCWPIPEGDLHQIQIDGDTTACPYCGFEASMDFWELREMDGLNEALGEARDTAII